MDADGRGWIADEIQDNLIPLLSKEGLGEVNSNKPKINNDSPPSDGEPPAVHPVYSPGHCQW